MQKKKKKLNNVISTETFTARLGSQLEYVVL